MTLKDFPTRIHPFDLYGFLQNIPAVDVLKTTKEVTLPIQNKSGKIEYYDKQNIIFIDGKEFVQTTTVPVITDEGMKLR